MSSTTLEPTSSTSSPARGAALVAALLLLAAAAMGQQQFPSPAGSPLAGGVPGPAPPGPVSLTLQEAVNRGLEHNLAIILGREQVRAAAGARKAARSRLFPDLAASLADSRNVINLEAYGFPVAPGESPLIGPFDVFDIRASLNGPLVDLSLWAENRSASHREDAAAATFEDLRDQVVLAVSSLYLNAVAAESRIVAARADVTTAEALYRQASDMKAAGVVAAIEVVRTEVQLAAERERLIVASNDAATSKLALARAIGLPLGGELKLEEPLQYSPPPTIGVAEALTQAFGQRADYKSARAAVAAARAALAAARNRALPALDMQANWGKIGPDPDSALTTYTVGAMVSVPVFTGGSIGAGKVTARAVLGEREAQLADLTAKIEYDVRSALLDLAAADQRTRVARDGLGLAEQQLEQSRDRFAAGVVSGVEVVQAQQALASAHDNQIASLLAYNLAEVRLARALGVAAEGLERFLGGSS